MNTVFWLIIAVLLLVAIALIVLPLLKNAALGNTDAALRNARIVKQQLAELQQQLNDGVLTQSQFDGQYQEMMLDLNDELDADTRIKTPGGSGKWIIPVVVLFVPLFSLALYLQLADPEALAKTQSRQLAEQNIGEVRLLIPQIIERLKQQPEDLQGWVMLGKSYHFIEDYQQASQVFAKLNQLAPNRPEFMLLYAESLAMTRNGELAGEPAELAFKAVQLAPDNKDALWMAAIAKVEAGQRPEALAYLQKLLTLLPDDAVALPQIQQMMAELSPETAMAAPASAEAVSFSVQVNVDSAVRHKIRPEEMLFVYAQTVDGPKMPIAANRKRVTRFPVSLELNDGMAMQPNRHMADFKHLRIVARISKTGNASSQPGDLIGVTLLDLPHNPQQPVSVLINEEVK
jgi:cytochrome c-type biogenesis protein CcmH